jgi:hypothetical protein
MRLLRSAAAAEACRRSRGAPRLGIRLRGLVLFVLLASLVFGGSAAGSIYHDPTCGCSPDPASPVDLFVSLEPLTGTPQNSTITTTPIESGFDTRTELSEASSEQRHWAFELTGTQRLVPLPSGAVAVVEDLALDPTVTEDDYSDGGTEDPADLSPESEVPEDPDGLDEDLDPPEETEAGPFEDLSEDPTGDGAVEALSDAEEALDGEGEVVAVVTPPSAVDALGSAVPADLFVAGNEVVLDVPHTSGVFAYPIEASSSMVEAAWDTTVSPEPPVACAARAKIVTYNPVGWRQLLNAFTQNPTRCADYFIVIAPEPGHPREVRPGAKEEICGANGPAVAAAGARIFPAAEFSYSGWRRWVKDHTGGRETGRVAQFWWRRAGYEFRRKMRNAGYGVAQCDGLGVTPARWAINEFGTTFTTRTERNPDIDPALVRLNAKSALLGLFYGFDGSGQGRYPNVQGIPWIIDPGQGRRGFSVYKPGLRRVILDSGFWMSARRTVLFWSQEAFTNCYKSCLARANRALRARHVNAYTLHPIKLSYLGQSAPSESDRRRAAIARTTLNPRYMPLLNGVWGAAFGANEKWGWTGQLTLEEMKGLASLQIYALRRHATGLSGAGADTSTAHARYPHLRVAVSWHEEPPGPYYDWNGELAARIAQALAVAYGPTGTAAAACVRGSTPDWCSIPVPDRSPPDARRNGFIPCWISNFDPVFAPPPPSVRWGRTYNCPLPSL